MTAGHGPNLGHGYVKYVVIDSQGNELPPVIFPAVTARAGRRVSGALVQVETVDAGGERWWVGEEALLSPSPLTLLAQERLSDPIFIPTLLRAALRRLGNLNGNAAGYAVTGLPATWAANPEKARQLGDRLRAATSQYAGIRVIAEPLGLVYSALLDTHGEILGDSALSSGTIAVVDLGHHTLDTAVISRLTPVPSSLNTFTLGTARPLREIRAQLSATFERELTLYETDLAVRAGALSIAGQPCPLPYDWDRPLRENGAAVVARLVEEWGSGAQFDAILLGGGGAEEPRLTEAITARFPHAVTVERPQTAIARGYAKLARRLARGRR
ncbi:MAG: ParM/StbA family protein [Oscillochloris sp.]|nr:ParM/StbA family protein [Oscillochloris sp.]